MGKKRRKQPAHLKSPGTELADAGRHGSRFTQQAGTTITMTNGAKIIGCYTKRNGMPHDVWFRDPATSKIRSEGITRLLSVVDIGSIACTIESGDKSYMLRYCGNV